MSMDTASEGPSTKELLYLRESEMPKAEVPSEELLL
jgi:hypothetical protein